MCMECSLLQHKYYYYPILPVRYARVRSSSGLVNIFCVLSYSISSPRNINIERSEIRFACDMLCVTMRIDVLPATCCVSR